MEPPRRGTGRSVARPLRVAEASGIGFRRGLVRRPRLVDRLLAAREETLALIVAPPGYGKSTLLEEWAERDPRPFVWLTLDDAPARLTSDAVATTIEDVKSRYRSFVLVVDNADTVPRALLRDVLVPLANELEEGSVLVVGSRREPPLPVGRLRAHRALVELRMRDLAMTSAEAATLLRRAGLKLEFEAVQTLVRETEGWPAALYLAALSLREDPELIGSAGFAADDHLLTEFLSDDVLSVIPPELTGLVMDTAVLDELSGPVCDDVLDARGSALALARLEKESQLLIPLDRAHHSYRWQRLLAGALRAELRRSEPERERRLQLRASHWYERLGDRDRAIEHAVAAGDAERTGALLWAGILSYIGAGRTGLVERWLSAFTHDQIAANAPLALSAAYEALAVGKLDQTRHWAVVAASVAERGAESGQPPSLATGLSLVEALVTHGRAAPLREAATRGYQVEARESPWRPVLCLLAGAAEHLLGRRDVSAAMLEEGAGLSSATAPSIAALCLAVAAMIALEQEDWDTAAELTDGADGLLQGKELDECPLSALVLAASAAVRAHQGRVDQAKHDLRRGIDLLAALGDYIPWYGAEARILLAHASLWLADVVGARALLAEASRLARKTPDAVIFGVWFDRAWAYMDTVAESSLSGPSALTIAELRVLRFLPSHRSFREIAGQLGVSANTVKTQAHAVYRKLGAASRSEAVARASEAGLLGQS
jgi:LuxR family transcriptional regulator, maltose regulon positive regulatory protein